MKKETGSAFSMCEIRNLYKFLLRKPERVNQLKT